jgi:hypothetical protein
VLAEANNPICKCAGVPKHQDKRMYYLYVLKSKKDGELYIGSTKDLKKKII